MSDSKMMEKFIQGDLTQYSPKKTKLKLAKLDGVAEYARKMKDWPLLEEAVEKKIQEQLDFCKWWEAKVTPAKGGPTKGGQVAPLGPDEITEWKRRVHRWKKYLNSMPAYRARLLGAEYKAALLADRNFEEEAKKDQDEVYTPLQYVEAARLVLGEIDLDPATSDSPQQIVMAKKFFTKKTDGLLQEWVGNVWLFPPRSQPGLSDFVDKLLDSLISGHVSYAILLLDARTDTSWFHKAESIAARICFTRTRIKFISPAEGEKLSTVGQAFFYYGEKPSAFEKVFSAFGFVR